MDVSIVIINYNTYDLISDALNSIIEYSKNFTYEIIVVDNCSPDGSGDKLQNDFVNSDLVKVYKLEDNVGTAKGFNYGVRKSTGDYVLWLNSDIVLFDNSIYHLYKFMSDNPSCGVCGGNLVNRDANPMHSFRMNLPTIKNMCSRLTLGYRVLKKISKKYDCEYNYTNKPMEVGYITGADMMVRKSLFSEIGFFDESIFMYSEESEFQFRVKNKTKFSIYSVPDCKIIHLEGASFDKNISFNEKKFRWMTLGQTKYFKICYGDVMAKKYLKKLLSKYKRLCVIFFAFPKMRDVLLKKKNCVKDFYNNYYSFVESFK